MTPDRLNLANAPPPERNAAMPDETTSPAAMRAARAHYYYYSLSGGWIRRAILRLAHDIDRETRLPELISALGQLVEASGSCGYDCEQGKLNDARQAAIALLAKHESDRTATKT